MHTAYVQLGKAGAGLQGSKAELRRIFLEVGRVPLQGVSKDRITQQLRAQAFLAAK